MVPRVSANLRAAVSLAVRDDRVRRGAAGPPTVRSASDDILHFQSLARRLRAERLPQLATTFHDPDDAIALPILLAPDISNLTASRAILATGLEKAGLRVYPVNEEDAEEIMIDRLSEHLSIGMQTNRAGGSTVVNSTRDGDTIVYCKGFFVSTATGFGRSTPAIGSLAPGRYTFALSSPNGQLDFDGLIWSCPHPNVRLNKP